MSRYDRYVLSQYLLLFGFFALILVSVLWVNRAVVLFDRLIADGQSAMVFLEFSALVLPNLVRMILPMAAFAAAVFVTNRLIRESELTVMQATGSSPARLARPALAFGLIAAAMMSVLTHFLLPASQSQLAARETEIARNATARLLTEGHFLHPGQGVTFYVRKIDPDGTLNDVFLSDSRDPARNVVYTGSRAYLVRDGGRSNLIIVDGMAQRLDTRNRTLSTTVFSDFSYDITPLMTKQKAKRRSANMLSTAELIRNPRAVAEETGMTIGKVIEVLHQRFARALISMVAPMVGFSALLLGVHSRFGLWRQILLAFGVLVGLELLRGALAEPIRDHPDLWPLTYLPGVSGLVLSGLFLGFAGRPVRWPLAGKAPA